MARRLAYGLALVIACLFAFFWAPATVSYRIAERYHFSGGSPGSPVFLHVFLPEAGPYQSVRLQRVVWRGVWEKRRVDGLPVLSFEGEGGTGDAGVDALIEYTVTIRQGRAEWEGTTQPSDLAPEEDIESDHPLIRQKAVELTSGNSDARKRAYRVHRFVAGYLAWPKDTRVNVTSSALQAFQSRVGVCEDFALLTVALCRAAGIPARVVSGLAFSGGPPLPFLSSRRTWGHPAGAHAWVEVYDGSRWLMADPSWAAGIAPHLHFGRNDGAHLSYGSASAAKRAYDETIRLVEDEGVVVGAMSAPLRFVAGAGVEGVTVLPEVTVQRRWDGRLANTLLTAVLVGYVAAALGRTAGASGRRGRRSTMMNTSG